MSAWKPRPGDLAMVKCSDGEWRAAWCMDVLGAPAWHFANGLMRDTSTSEARPLVVIDPGDRDAVVGLTERFFAEHDPKTHGYDGMQAALCSLLAPPKPDEPTGLGAVVEDAEGTRWVHRGRGFVTAWARIATTPDEAYGKACGWSDIAAVRVLSEGVAE